MSSRGSGAAVSAAPLPSMRKPRAMAASLVGGLVAAGTLLALGAGDGSIARELGLAVLGGGIVGGCLVAVESLLASAADQRSAAASLRLTLSMTGDLNGIDLSRAQLARIYLPGRAMVAADLSGADLRGAKLQFADLRFALLRGTVLRGADLRGATLAGADLTGADLHGALLDDADISDAELDGADIAGATLFDARAQRTRFGSADLDGTRFSNVFLEGADLSAVRGRPIFGWPVQHDDTTRWPTGFDVPEAGTVIQAPIAEMELASYLAHRGGLRHNSRGGEQ